MTMILFYYKNWKTVAKPNKKNNTWAILGFNTLLIGFSTSGKVSSFKPQNSMDLEESGVIVSFQCSDGLILSL